MVYVRRTDKWEGITMGWSGWFSDSNGDKVNEKTEKTDSGSREHFLRSSDDRNDHSHVIVERDDDGKSRAFAAPKTSKR